VTAKSCVCQNLVAKVGQTCCIGLGQFCCRENVFDLRKRSYGSMKRTEQVYVNRMVKAAKLAMVRIEYRFTSLVMVADFIPSSYVDLSFLCRIVCFS
jgi:hypothetical protein